MNPLERKPMKRTRVPVERKCDNCAVSISRKNTNGLCRVCFCSVVGKTNAKPHPPCEYCGQLCPTTNRKYCSRECYIQGHIHPRGPDHHSWTGDSVGFWGARRRTQNTVATSDCEQCGQPNADRHHKDRNILNNAAENIAFLCRSCHAKLHCVEDGPPPGRRKT